MTENKVFKNATWIIACKIVQSLLGLVVSMFSARYLGPAGYGLINYAGSIVAFVAPIMQLGLNMVMVQEIVNSPEKEGETLGTALVMNVTSSLLCVLGIVGFVAVANRGETETLIVCALYSVLLIFQALEMVQYWFQAKLKSKYVSVVALIAYTVMSAYKIFLLIAKAKVYWFALSQAIDYMVIALTLLVIYKKLGGQGFRFSKDAMKRMWHKSKHYIVSSLMVTLFTQTDKIMLKLMTDDTQTGYYSSAVACAGITSFVFAALIDSFRPSIFEAKKTGDKGFEKNMVRLYSLIIYLSLAQCLAMTLFAPLIIKILYGANYAPASPALRIIVWYTTFAYLGSVRNIWILSENKQKYLWILNLSGALMNIALNAVLIPVWGINGAALASLVTQVFTNVVMNMLIKPIRRNNLFMWKSLNPKVLLEMIRVLIKKKPASTENVEINKENLDI